MKGGNMTKKDYIRLAGILLESKLNDQEGIHFNGDKLVSRLCGILKEDNPNFNKEKFLQAAGLGG